MSALRLARAFTGRGRRSSSSSAATTATRICSSCRRDRASRRSGFPTRPASPPAPSRDTLTAPYNDLDGGRDALRRARRHRGGDRRAGRREHGPRPSRAGLPRGAARAHRRARSAARLRRGDDRVPRASGRRAGALRRHARPDDARQGDRRRAPGRGVRRPPRDHGARRSGRRRVPGGNAVGEPARDDRGDRDLARAIAEPRRLGSARSAPGARLEEGLGGARLPGLRSRAQERCSACSSRTCPSRAGTRPKRADTGALRRVSTARCSSAASTSLRRSSRPASSRRCTATPEIDATISAAAGRARRVSDPRVYPSRP